ncbi:hypothetical protein [Phytoactinopolyspora mesophila]|uniref:Uncharacterized protein n=1 Tax=Phytoactinopolyspora mesophila TaxID=2650750 RepID=A0A7K3MBI4_9ACTN|nr:hypothetical protein [Phytoactinopolyspora mesophila]NDL60685.1 hypothetical protein [Phytoactinopolyspora mesophila]
MPRQLEHETADEQLNHPGATGGHTGVDTAGRPADGGDGRWPVLFRIRPRYLLLAVAAFVITAWTLFIAVDIVNVNGFGDRIAMPMWTYLFNDHVVEVSQWVMLAVVIAVAGYLGGRLAGTAYRGASTFFFLLAVGLGLMLVEEAGDVRHGISGAVRLHFGSEVFGLPYQVVSDFPYFAALAAIPLYAVLRYGRYAWEAVSARPYLVVAVVLYGMAAIGSGLRHLGSLYVNLGSAVDQTFFGGRFPPSPGMSQERAHYFVVDGPIEETVELFAVTCMLAMVLAFAAELRSGRLVQRSTVVDSAVTDG